MRRRRANADERTYFRRVAEGSASLAQDSVPASLAEMFDRLEWIQRTHGRLVEPGVSGEDESELEGHRRLVARAREMSRRGEDRA